MPGLVIEPVRMLGYGEFSVPSVETPPLNRLMMRSLLAQAGAGDLKLPKPTDGRYPDPVVPVPAESW